MCRESVIPRCRGRAPIRGFTLIELLVVISIISILIAILLPALGQARKVANSMKCLTILRQVQMANHMYADQYREWYLPTRRTVDGGSMIWTKNPAFGEVMKINAAGESQGSIVCPLASYALNNPQPSGLIKYQLAYGSNITGLALTDSGGSILSHIGYKRTDILTPANKLAYADSVDWWIRDTSAWKYIGETGNSGAYNFVIAYRHNNSSNLSFFDGHARTIPRENIDNAVLSADALAMLWNPLVTP